MTDKKPQDEKKTDENKHSAIKKMLQPVFEKAILDIVPEAKSAEINDSGKIKLTFENPNTRAIDVIRSQGLEYEKSTSKKLETIRETRRQTWIHPITELFTTMLESRISKMPTDNQIPTAIFQLKTNDPAFRRDLKDYREIHSEDLQENYRRLADLHTQIISKVSDTLKKIPDKEFAFENAYDLAKTFPLLTWIVGANTPELNATIAKELFERVAKTSQKDARGLSDNIKPESSEIKQTTNKLKNLAERQEAIDYISSNLGSFSRMYVEAGMGIKFQNSILRELVAKDHGDKNLQDMLEEEIIRQGGQSNLSKFQTTCDLLYQSLQGAIEGIQGTKLKAFSEYIDLAEQEQYFHNASKFKSVAMKIANIEYANYTIENAVSPQTCSGMKITKKGILKESYRKNGLTITRERNYVYADHNDLDRIEKIARDKRQNNIAQTIALEEEIAPLIEDPDIIIVDPIQSVDEIFDLSELEDLVVLDKDDFDLEFGGMDLLPQAKETSDEDTSSYFTKHPQKLLIPWDSSNDISKVKIGDVKLTVEYNPLKININYNPSNTEPKISIKIDVDNGFDIPRTFIHEMTKLEKQRLSDPLYAAKILATVYTAITKTTFEGQTIEDRIIDYQTRKKSTEATLVSKPDMSETQYESWRRDWEQDINTIGRYMAEKEAKSNPTDISELVD